MALTKEDLQAIQAALTPQFDSINGRLDKLDGRLDKVEQRLNTVERDIKSIKRDTSITRVTVNAIGEWVDLAEHAIRIDYPVKK